MTLPGSVRRLDRLLARAGRPQAWPIARVLAAKLILPLVAGALSLLYISGKPGSLSVVIGIAITVISHFLPDLLLHSRGQERSQQIALQIPDTLDQMTIAVEAGLGFDSAMARAGKNGKGVLAEELVRTLQDIQVGQSRRGCLRVTGYPDRRPRPAQVCPRDHPSRHLWHRRLRRATHPGRRDAHEAPTAR